MKYTSYGNIFFNTTPVFSQHVILGKEDKFSNHVEKCDNIFTGKGKLSILVAYFTMERDNIRLYNGTRFFLMKLVSKKLVLGYPEN